ncbi:hypothetical protein MANES_03G068700v8 [Manihot esculenta]|uniref:Uncharacterized protein n=1 Tax=Manihot esculenta TaxID=3983 RepID=A0ACB7HZA5_MANES|nr:hypothetical protein MANES_03G068700v8 [Manihot esculenta]
MVKYLSDTSIISLLSSTFSSSQPFQPLSKTKLKLPTNITKQNKSHLKRRRSAMAKLLSLFSFFLLTALSSSESPNPYPPTAAHVQLTNYGFPIGLLPSSVLNYTLDSPSGVFSIDFGGACKVTLPPDNYLATYSKKVTGKIAQGQIAELDGIRVRAFFKWWSITGIRANGENLVFEVGMVTAKYPSKKFNESPECEGKHSAS